MKLTRKKAIKLCQELWEEITASKMSKARFLMTPTGQRWHHEFISNCPLCDWNYQHIALAEMGLCSCCPLPKVEGRQSCRCYKLGYRDDRKPSKKWLEVIRNLT